MASSYLKPISHVLLGISGGIDCLNSAKLLIQLWKVADRVTVVMTPAAMRMMPADSLRAINSTEVLTDPLTNHMSLPDSIDLFLIAPATANTIAKLSSGIGDNLLTTAAIALSCRRVVAPSMSSNMWENTIVQRNCKFLQDSNFHVIPPTVGTEVLELKECYGAMPNEKILVKLVLKHLRQQNTKEFTAFQP
ncbi:flavoprotein [Microbulbifer sp. VTAC004]|uniref:flavoprotein n=1 Tax=Microbulbifer sp. VTAC004 TaxID=3243386 RepID=UPI004039DDF9